MRIIGIDLSTTKTGLIDRGRDGRFVPYLIERAKRKKKDPPLTPIEIYEELLPQIMVVIPKTSRVIMEDYGFAFKGSGILNVELGSLIRWYIKQLTGEEALLVPPKTLTKFISGTGGVDKDDKMKQVYKRYGVDLKTSHENEAYALTEIAALIFGWAEIKKIPKHQQEVVGVVLKLNERRLINEKNI